MWVALMLSGCGSNLGSTDQAIQKFGAWTPPVNVGPPLNTQYNDTYAFVTRDGLDVYFTSDRPGGLGGDDLWMSHRETVDSTWQEPTNLAVLNTAAADSLAVLSFDEETMIFSSTRAGGCGASDVWMSKRAHRDAEWSTPFNIGCVVNTGAAEQAPALLAGKTHHHSPTTLFYGSNRAGGLGDFDVYASSSDDPGLAAASFGPGVLVPELSSAGRDTRVWPRRDGLEIFITSDRAGGVGKIDLWVATRASRDDKWSKPVDIAAPINSVGDDGSPQLSQDGGTLYFFSNRAGGLGGRDIYFTTRPFLVDDEDDDDE